MGATARSYIDIGSAPAPVAALRRGAGGITALDPRLLQILFLGILLAAGAWFRDFSIRPAQIVLTFAAAVGCQGLLARITGQSSPSYRSAFITALSITLLLRSDNLFAHPIAAAAAITSKFLLRVRAKHVFNPANFGIVFALLGIRGTWISAGQWGQDVAFAAWLLVLGNLVVHRVRRADVSWSFLLIYMSVLAGRIAWLGQNAAVWTHQLSNGALLLFAFFMISDPMTIPNHPRARILHASVVAFLTYIWQFGLYRNNALIWALFAAAPLVPIWDSLWRAPQFRWVSQGGNDGAHKTTMVAAVYNHRLPARGLFVPFPRTRVLRLLRRQGRRTTI
jgi:enediyne biosynthesis protein E5